MKTLLIAFSLFVEVWSIDYTCLPGSSPSGVSLPRGDIYLQHDSNQTLFCLLNPDHDYYAKQGFRAKDLYFWTPHGNLESRIVNSTTISTNFIANTVGTLDVQCQVQNMNRSIGICKQRLFVGFPPLNVTNFSCVSENWHNLNCTWDEAFNPVPTVYDVSFMEPGAYSHPKYCPRDEDLPLHVEHIVSEQSCYLDLTTHPPYRQAVSTYKFYVNASNPLVPGGTIYPISVEHTSIVKPGKAVNLNLTSKSSSQLVLSYSVPNEMRTFSPGIVQHVRYIDEWTRKWTSVDMSNFSLHQDDFDIEVSNLKFPHSNYTFEIKMVSGSADPTNLNLWSDLTYISGRTNATVPAQAPTINLGSFEVLDTGSDRTVFAYWKIMRPRDFNGPGFRYLASVNKVPIPTSSSYARFDKVSVSEFQVQISAENNVGMAPVVSTLKIPQKEFLYGLQPKSLTKIWKGIGRYEIAWRSPDREDEVTSYTLFWCKSEDGKDRPYQCDGELDWKTLEPCEGTVQSHPLILPSENVYQIAVSANTNTLSSGMVWSTCTVIKDRLVSRVTQIEILHQKPTSLTVRWSLDCRDQAGIVYGYRIEYCTAEVCKAMNVSPDHDRVQLGGLIPFTQYTIGVRIKDKVEYGELGSMVKGETLPDKPGSPPLRLQVDEITSSSALISWEPPAVPNGIIGEYRVQYVYFNSENKREGRHDVFINTTSVVLTNLISYSRYEVNVTACTVLQEGALGCSHHYAVHGFKTKIGPPAKPPPPRVEFENSTLVKINWNKQFQIGAPEALKWEVKVRRAGSAWDTTKPYTKNITGALDQFFINLDHIMDIKGWSPDCENETNTNKFEFAVRAIVKDLKEVEYGGNWSESVPAAAYCSQVPAWGLITLVCVVVSIAAVFAAFLCCRFYQFWYKTKDFFGQVGKELDTKFVLASTDNLDPGSPGPEFEMNQFSGNSVRKDDNDDDDTDTLLLENTTPEQKNHRQKSASESATSDLTSGCESQGGKSCTDRVSDCSSRSHLPVQADLASTCSGYVSMHRADSGGSGSNYTQLSGTPSRPCSNPSSIHPLNIDTTPATSSFSAQYSNGFGPGLVSSAPYLSRAGNQTFGNRLSSSHQPEILGAMLEETCLTESNNPGYSLFTGTVSVPISFPVERSVTVPGSGYVSAGAANRPVETNNLNLSSQQIESNISQRLGIAEQLNCIQSDTGYITVQQAQELVLQPNPASRQYSRLAPKLESAKFEEPEPGFSPPGPPGNYISPSYV